MSEFSRERGFALVLVIWAIALISLMMAGYATVMRSEIKLASNTVEAQRAELLADAATELAILDLVRSASLKGHQAKFPLDTTVVCTISDIGLVRLTISDEAGRIDLNGAGIPLLEALFSGLGFPDRASAFAASLYDYKDADDDERPNGAERSRYVASGLTLGPKNADLAGAEELSQVPGFDAEVLRRLKPYVTVHTGQSGIDASAAPKALIKLLQRGSAGRIVSLSSFPELDSRYALPRIFLSPSRRNVFAVRSEARTHSGARFSREAIVRLDKGRSRTFEVLRWRTPGNANEAMPNSAAAKRC